jgi:hypothetical protein
LLHVPPLQDLTTSYMGLATEYLASYYVSQVGLSVSESMLGQATVLPAMLGLPSTTAATIVGNLGKLARGARAVRRAGARHAQTQAEGVLLHGINWALGFLGFRLKKAEEVSMEDEDDESTDEELDTEDEVICVIELSDKKLDGYCSEEDPDYIPTAEEFAKAEAEEAIDIVDVKKWYEMILKTFEASKNVSVELSETKLDKYVSEEDPDYEPTAHENEYMEAEITEEDCRCFLSNQDYRLVRNDSDNSNVETDSEYSAHDDLTGEEDSDPAPSVMTRSFGLISMDSSDDEVEFLSGHCLPKTIASFVKSGTVKTEPAEDEVVYVEGHCLVRIIKIEDIEEEVYYVEGDCLPKIVKIEHEDVVHYVEDHCLPKIVKTEPDDVVFEEGHYLAKTVELEPQNEVHYVEGNCLPKIVKTEPEDDLVSEEDHYVPKTVYFEPQNEVHYVEGDCLPKIVKTEPEDEIHYMEGHCLPLTVETEPEDEIHYLRGHCLPTIVKTELKDEVVYEEGHCIPKAIMIEPQEDVNYVTGHCLPKTVKTEPEDEIHCEEAHCLPTIVETEPKDEVVFKSSFCLPSTMTMESEDSIEKLFSASAKLVMRVYFYILCTKLDTISVQVAVSLAVDPTLVLDITTSSSTRESNVTATTIKEEAVEVAVPATTGLLAVSFDGGVHLEVIDRPCDTFLHSCKQ